MNDSFLKNILITIPFWIGLILWWFISLKWCLLFYGMYSFGMYFHITITTLSNAFIGRDINMSGDLFWKIVFLILGCLCLTLFFWL